MKKILFIIFIIILAIILILLNINKQNSNLSNTKSSLITHTIDVAYITDLTYILPTATSINSIIQNKNENTKINIYVIGVNLNKVQKESIEEISTKDTKIKVILKDTDTIKIPKQKFLNKKVSKANYMIFYLAEILNKTDKVIYLDSDTIVLKDLTELYNTDLEDNYIAAVDDWQSKWFDNRNARYFNSGVMLMNLKKLRDDNIELKLLKTKENDKINRFRTQDAINIVMEGKIKPLPLKYNIFGFIYNKNDLLKYIETSHIVMGGGIYDENFHSYKTANDCRKDTVIIHYCGFGTFKPWWKNADKRTKANKLWYKYEMKRKVKFFGRKK